LNIEISILYAEHTSCDRDQTMTSNLQLNAIFPLPKNVAYENQQLSYTASYIC